MLYPWMSFNVVQCLHSVVFLMKRQLSSVWQTRQLVIFLFRKVLWLYSYLSRKWICFLTSFLSITSGFLFLLILMIHKIIFKIKIILWHSPYKMVKPFLWLLGLTSCLMHFFWLLRILYPWVKAILRVFVVVLLNLIEL